MKAVLYTRVSTGKQAASGLGLEAQLAECREHARRKGYEVLVATDGLDALKVSESHAGTIDLLLTDVVMPGLSGPEAAQRLAARRPQMKTLYVSGYTDASVVRLGAARGEVAFLRKPITPSMLTGRIREILDAPDVKAMLDAKRAPGGHSPSE